MMSCKKGRFLYSFFILLTQRHELPVPKLTNFHIFVIPLPFNVKLFSKKPYLTAYIMKQVVLESLPKKNQIYLGPSRQLKWSSLWH